MAILIAYYSRAGENYFGGAYRGLLQNSFLQQPYCFTLSILFRGQGCRLQPKFLF